ncbi:Mitogen-activated protein kinase adapter protein MST50 [Podospora bellae-mahoneyi]|uniref:Mitogen-activated protein kinase adapter protein MST50 n=1 Tax=Podospora bellae-mahoneyi TaxID=2093777 RepID=A0ABR0F6I7_9PEZI|nr:Mitogen-activated protein kinase adapter protein MST50 [Podospora bellae-mahoneyi]
MNFDSGTAYAESDADDEYERDIHGSSPMATDVETSPIDSDPPSTEHTPTTYGYRSSADRLPETIISEWTAEECADFIASIGVQQYADIFLENEIVGEALVALQHDDLKSMGINSVGHRLTILKSVYDVKKAQDVPIESDHYMPPTAETEAQAANATLKDIQHLVQQLRVRDERISMFEQDLRRLTDDFRRLREDMLPALRLAKDYQQPLPNDPSYGDTLSPPAPTPSSANQYNSSLSRKYSTKVIKLGSTPKATSPTHLQTTHNPSLVEQTLDPSGAADRAVMSSSHLAAMNGVGSSVSPGYPSPNMPSPTSPPTTGLAGNTLSSRAYRSDQPPQQQQQQPQQPPSSTRTTFSENDHYGNQTKTTAVPAPRRMQTPAPETPGSSNSVEIFKSFRVSMDDPCYKVLPAALKKYQINAPWDQYALYIVYGDQERCLGLDEKPLILFKQLDKEGKKPMFMLRKTNNAQAGGAVGGDGGGMGGGGDGGQQQQQPGSAGLGSGGRGGGMGMMGYDPPGGII